MPESQSKIEMKYLDRSSPRYIMLCFFCFVTFPGAAAAQLSFASAVSLALQYNPRIRVAQLDVQKAQAGLAVARDMFIPSVVTGGGLGWTYGITLTVPTIFTINAQSLVYSNQQRFQVRAARADLEAAQFALAEARQQTEEDAVITYISLDENQAYLAALNEQHEFAIKLVSILEDRVKAGLDAEIDLKKAQRAALQIGLQQMQAEDERASLVAHLAELTGLPSNATTTSASSIPRIPEAIVTSSGEGGKAFTSPAILSEEANAKGKLERARGDAGYTWRPIITFAAQYGRVSPINNVSSFYNLHDNYNTANVGIQFAFPMLDKVRKAAARESLADAMRTVIDLNNQKAEQAAKYRKLQRSIRETETREEMTELDFEIAQEELKSTTIQLHAPTGSSPLTPKDEQNARMQERQKYLDLLDARLQLSKAKISLLRQVGELDDWLHSLAISSTNP